MPVTRTRINKLSHSDTILYEIYMLRFSCDRLIRSHWENERDAWVYLESFLIHYRNLIEFLGKRQSKGKLRKGDIHVTNLWALEGLTPPSWVKQVHIGGQSLFAKYEGQADRISRYLQHCTTQRVQLKDWLVDKMYNEIEPLVSQVEGVLQPTNRLLQAVPPLQIVTAHAASTAVVTATAVAPIRLKPTEDDW